MKQFINKYFSLILFLSCIIGLFFPDLGKATIYLIPTMLAIVIFTSFFQIEFVKEILIPDTKKTIKFYIIRYLVIPIVVFIPISYISPFYATVVLLLFLLPAAVSSPAFSTILGGNANLSVVILLISSILSPLIIPFFCSLFIHTYHPIVREKMFVTLFLTVVLPFILHLPLRKFTEIKKWMISYNPFITIVCISFIFVIALAKYRIQLFANISKLPEYALFSSLIYISLYLIGWYIQVNSERKDKITFSVSSGANNIGLGVTLTIIYFSPDVNIFFIIANIIWTFILIPLKRWFKNKTI